MFKYFSLKRLWHYIFLTLSHLPMRGHHRWIFLKLGGVRFSHKNPTVYIYNNVEIDTVHPEMITIGNNVRITTGTKILTHYIDTNSSEIQFKTGHVIIEDDVFIGMNTIICNSVTIGRGAIIGAGSIITKDIPPYEVWAGNPAHYIKHRNH